MPSAQITSAAGWPEPQPTYPKHDWPLEDLEVGQGFALKLTPSGHDKGLTAPCGRRVSTIRVLVSQAGRRLGRRFHCGINRYTSQLYVSRSA